MSLWPRKDQKLGLLLAALLLLAPGCTGITPEHLASVGKGTLLVTVRWPKAAYQTQVIPTDTTEVDLTLSQGSNTIQTLNLTRASGQNSVTTSAITLPAGNYTLLATAYPLGATSVTAQGTASATVNADEVDAANLTMNGSYVPGLTSWTPNAGYGAQLSLSGPNLDYAFPTEPGLVVTFGGSVAGIGPSLASSTSASVTVPAGAQNGDLQILADGIPSTGTYSFTVINAVSITPATANVTISGATTTPTSVTLTGTASDPLGLAIASPDLQWVTTNSSMPSPSLKINGTGANVTVTCTTVSTMSSPATGTLQLQAGAGSTVIATTSYTIDP